MNPIPLDEAFQTLSSQMMDCKIANSPLFYSNQDSTSLDQQIDAVKKQTTENEEIIEKFRSEQEQFQINHSKLQEINEYLSQHRVADDSLLLSNDDEANQFLISKSESQKLQMELVLKGKTSLLNKLSFLIVENMRARSDDIQTMINSVLDKELFDWKRSQQLAGNSYNFDTSHLDILQTQCEGVFEIIWLNLTKVKEVTRIFRSIAEINTDMNPTFLDSLFELNKKFTKHLTTIVLNTFILEKQPPQVIKIQTRFTAKIRFLVGGKLHTYMNGPPEVVVSIINEAQANILLTGNKHLGDATGEILFNKGIMEYDPGTKQLSITFSNLQLRRITRGVERMNRSESAGDEKFSLYFTTKFTITGELEFEVWTMSLPVVVIAHGYSQEPRAWATIMWDNAFGEIARRPFEVPNKVPWGKVARAINFKFQAVTGRHLTNDNINYLAEKLFRCQYPKDYYYDTMQVSWSLFSKELLAYRRFTFCDWFYAIMKLTKLHLKSIWTDGYILGFVRKQEAENMLMFYPDGTFLLRFSDSVLGGITVAWVENTDNRKQVVMLQPFTERDFAIRSLADRLYDLHYLLYLYPDIPKDLAFDRHYTVVTHSQTASSNGYVQTLLVNKAIPGASSPTISVDSERMTGSTMGPMSDGGWDDPFATMGPGNNGNVSDFADFSVFQNPPMTDM